jgi:hypothetical protein
MRRAKPNPGQFDLFDPVAPLRNESAKSHLPETANRLIECIGLEATLALVKEETGNELRLPEVAGGVSQAWARLVEIIGEEAATRLVKEWPDTRVYVPTCKAALRHEERRRLIARYDAGEPFDSIRRSYGVSRSALYRILKTPL